MFSYYPYIKEGRKKLLAINVIHDCRMSERYEPLVNELYIQGLSSDHFRVWMPFEDTSDVVRSINMSQKSVVQKAKDEGLDMVAILEDDVFFPSRSGLKYFLNNMPDCFDIYLGGTYLIDNQSVWEPPLVKVNSYVGHHLIVVARKYYDRFLDTPETHHIDTAQEGRGDFYVCYPMPALQKAGWSSNNKAVCDYNAVLDPKHIYK